jgi:hypothetical protein
VERGSCTAASQSPNYSWSIHCQQLFEEAADLVFTVDEVAFENPMTQSTLLPLEV